jgi:hypothetical protein
MLRTAHHISDLKKGLKAFRATGHYLGDHAWVHELRRGEGVTIA